MYLSFSADEASCNQAKRIAGVLVEKLNGLCKINEKLLVFINAIYRIQKLGHLHINKKKIKIKLIVRKRKIRPNTKSLSNLREKGFDI